MPSRLMSLLILIYWSIAAFCLLKWDVLPELSMGYPPDLRAIAFASESDRPVRWSIQVAGPSGSEDRRTIGEAVTSSKRQADGWYEMSSRVDFDADDLLRGTILAMRESLPVQVRSRYYVDPSGNLQNFDLHVTTRDNREELVHVSGKLRGATMEITSKGPLPILNKTWPIRYEPRSVVSDILAPFDRLPGLHPGQRWEMQVVNPLSGGTEQVRVEVTGQATIPWAGNVERTYVVEQKVSGMKMRTWVRPDGLILRQEVPFPLVRTLILERRAEEARPSAVSASPAAAGRPSP